MKKVIIISIILFQQTLFGQNKFICITVVPDNFIFNQINKENPHYFDFSRDSLKFLNCLKLHAEVIDIEAKEKFEKMNKKWAKKPFFFSPSCILIPGEDLNKINSFSILQIELYFACGFTQYYYNDGNCLSPKMKNLIDITNCFPNKVMFENIKVLDSENDTVKTIRMTLILK